MDGWELIEKYFSDHPDKEFNTEFKAKGGFFSGHKSPIYGYQQLPENKVIILYQDRSEERDIRIVEDDGIPAWYTLAVPLSIVTRKGSFLCGGVTSVKERKPKSNWRTKDVKITKSIWPWSKRLTVRISNNKINLVVKCLTITPHSVSVEMIKNSSAAVNN